MILISPAYGMVELPHHNRTLVFARDSQDDAIISLGRIYTSRSTEYSRSTSPSSAVLDILPTIRIHETASTSYASHFPSVPIEQKMLHISIHGHVPYLES